MLELRNHLMSQITSLKSVYDFFLNFYLYIFAICSARSFYKYKIYLSSFSSLFIFPLCFSQSLHHLVSFPFSKALSLWFLLTILLVFSLFLYLELHIKQTWNIYDSGSDFYFIIALIYLLLFPVGINLEYKHIKQ